MHKHHPAGSFVVIASTSDSLWRIWSDALTGMVSVHPVRDTETLEAAIRQHRPASIVADLDMIDGPAGIIRIKGLLPAARVMAVTRTDAIEEAAGAIMAGARGHIHHEADAELIRSAMTRMAKDEIWARRRVLEAIVDRAVFGAAPPPGHHVKSGPVSALSQREKEVAVLVAQGMCYKLIARQLDVAENTVRNHVRHIFKKLAISDRLQLALLIRGSDLFVAAP